jgi:hypothetical protein
LKPAGLNGNEELSMTRLRRRTIVCAVLFGIGQLLAVGPRFGIVAAQSASTTPKYTSASCGKPVCTWNAFGPQTFTRQTGKPQAVSANFSVLNPTTQYTLAVQSDGVASAVISLNGAVIFGPADFNLSVTTLQRTVSVQRDNTITVELRGKPGSSLTLTVIGVDSDPPGINYTENPRPNQYGWNNMSVTLSFACTDKTSGVAFCSNPVTLTSEGLGLMASGMAQDRAGNTATVTVPVNIDKTPPTITARVGTTRRSR